MRHCHCLSLCLGGSVVAPLALGDKEQCPCCPVAWVGEAGAILQEWPLYLAWPSAGLWEGVPSPPY